MDFDLSKVSAIESFEPLPEGKYEAVITEAAWHLSQNSGKTSLKLTFEVGKRKIWDYLSVNHAEAKVREFSLGKLKKILICLGYDQFTFSDAQLFKALTQSGPLMLSLKIRQRSDESGNIRKDNTISAYFPLEKKALGPEINLSTGTAYMPDNMPF